MSCFQLIWRTLTEGRFDQHAWKRREAHARSLLRSAQCNKTVDSTTSGGWQGSRAMQVMFVLGLEFALSKSDAMAPRGLTRIGLQDDVTFIGSAAALNRTSQTPWLHMWSLGACI